MAQKSTQSLSGDTANGIPILSLKFIYQQELFKYLLPF